MDRLFYRREFPYARLNITLWLIIINVAVFFFYSMWPHTRYFLWMIPVQITRNGYYWQFITYMFSHASFSHILFNMLGLFFFGNQVEMRMGSYEFLLYYLLTGILAGVLSFAIYVMAGEYLAALVGASGAVFAVLLAFATFYPDARIYVMGLIPVRASILVILFTAYEIFNHVFNTSSGVAHLTHLAGFGFGFLYFLVRFGINPFDRLLPPGGRR